ncbi:MAG: Ig-like domain-containing protein, partial [Rubrobacteraceae bacterium]
LGKVGADIPRPMNAIGYRSTDRSLYGYQTIKSPGILKVNPTTGAARYLGNPRGLPASSSYIAGDVSPNGSTYYLYANKSGVLRKVNLKTFRASSVKLSSKMAVADFEVSLTDGNLYGVAQDGRLLRIDPQTGRVTASSVAGLEPGSYGAAWFTAAGDLIVYENGTSSTSGTMVWIGRPTTTEPIVVSKQAAASTFGNDGAAYVAPPNPAGLSVEVNVLANDGDPGVALDRNTLRIVEQPTNGTVLINADKTITYTSGPSYRGTDSFRYEVCDNGVTQQCGVATVNITSAPIMGPTNRAASRKE